MSDISKKRIGETRKIQMTGGSTYIISLPKKWVEMNRVGKGDEVFVKEEDDGSLSIASKLEEKEQKDEALIRVASNDKQDAVMRKAISAYLVGYNILHIKSQGQQPLAVGLRNYLKSFTRNYLVGTEIVNDSPTDLTLQVLLNYQETQRSKRASQDGNNSKLYAQGSYRRSKELGLFCGESSGRDRPRS